MTHATPGIARLRLTESGPLEGETQSNPLCVRVTAPLHIEEVPLPEDGLVRGRERDEEKGTDSRVGDEREREEREAGRE